MILLIWLTLSPAVDVAEARRFVVGRKGIPKSNRPAVLIPSEKIEKQGGRGEASADLSPATRESSLTAGDARYTEKA